MDERSASVSVDVALGKMVDGESEEFFGLFEDRPAEYSIAAIFGLLAMLIERRYGAHPRRDQLIHAALSIHASESRPQLPPRSMVEAALRGASGESEILLQAPSPELLEAAGLAVRFLVTDLNRSSADRAELVAGASIVVARTFEILDAEN